VSTVFGVLVTMVLPAVLIPVVVVKLVDLLKQDIYNSLPGVHERGLVAQVDSVLPSPPERGVQPTLAPSEGGKRDVSRVRQSRRLNLITDFTEFQSGKLDCAKLLESAESPVLVIRLVAGKPGSFEVAFGHLANESPSLGDPVERPTDERADDDARK
jgi:hypothetical protein